MGVSFERRMKGVAWLRHVLLTDHGRPDARGIALSRNHEVLFFTYSFIILLPAFQVASCWDPEVIGACEGSLFMVVHYKTVPLTGFCSFCVRSRSCDAAIVPFTSSSFFQLLRWLFLPGIRGYCWPLCVVVIVINYKNVSLTGFRYKFAALTDFLLL